MDLLKQCQKWIEQNEIQKVIDALEAIPAEAVSYTHLDVYKRQTLHGLN